MSQVKANAMAIVALTSPESNKNANFYEMSSEKSYELCGAPNNITCCIEHVKVAKAIFLQGSAFNHSCMPNAHASFVSRHLYIRSTKPIIAGSPVELCYGAQAGETGRLERQSWLKERYFFDCRCFACSEENLGDVYISAYRCHDSSCDGAVPANRIFSKNSRATKESSDGCLTSEEQQDFTVDLECSTACCIKCRLLVDTKSYQIVLIRNINNIKRASASIQTQSFDSKQLQYDLEIACASLKNLRFVLHQFNKVLAEAEDTVAQLLCATRQPQKALLHCGNSIEILEQLYGKDHIVVANERMKLASIALAANDLEQAKNNLEFVKHVYCVHYGPKFQARFPFMDKLLASCPYMG